MTITYGECGHPLRRHALGVFVSPEGCRLCALDGVVTEAQNGDAHPTPWQRDPWLRAWRGREDEANAWEASHLTDEQRGAVERSLRKQHMLHGVGPSDDAALQHWLAGVALLSGRGPVILRPAFIYIDDWREPRTYLAHDDYGRTVVAQNSDSHAATMAAYLDEMQRRIADAHVGHVSGFQMRQRILDDAVFVGTQLRNSAR